MAISGMIDTPGSPPVEPLQAKRGMLEASFSLGKRSSMPKSTSELGRPLIEAGFHSSRAGGVDRRGRRCAGHRTVHWSHAAQCDALCAERSGQGQQTQQPHEKNVRKYRPMFAHGSLRSWLNGVARHRKNAADAQTVPRLLGTSTYGPPAIEAFFAAKRPCTILGRITVGWAE